MLKIPKIPKTYNDEIFVSLGGGEWKADEGYANYKAINDDYKVTINGISCGVRECRVSAIPFNRPWPGRQRDIHQSEPAAFITFSSDEEVELQVKTNRAFENAVIRPLSKGIIGHLENHVIRFRLKEHGSYVLELDDAHNALHIFYNPIKEYPEAEKATYYFGPGMHFPGVISLKDSDCVYIHEEAIVFGSIYADGAKNIRVFGGGVLDNSCEERITEHCYEYFTKGALRLYHCENVSIQDVILLNSSTWVMSFFECNHVEIDRVKLVGHWRYNTDGIDIVNTSNVAIRNSFVRSFDDTITIKGIYDYPNCIENISVENCVLWCGWGHNCEIGVETEALEYRNITFKNCDLIHSSGPSLAIANGSYANIHDVHYENMRVEYQQSTLPEIFQESAQQIYDGYGKTATPFLIRATNDQYAIRTINNKGVVRKVGHIYGNIWNITYKNIHVFMEKNLPKPIIRICSYDEDLKFSGFSIEGLFINGEKQLDLSGFQCEIDNTEDIYFG